MHVTLSKEYREQEMQSPPRWARPGINRTAFQFLSTFDPAVHERLDELLREPDDKDLKGRGQVLKFEGAPDRFRRWLPIRFRAIRARELAALGLDEGALEE